MTTNVNKYFLLLIQICLCSSWVLHADEPTNGLLLTGSDFQKTLGKPLTANWNNVEYRAVLQKISSNRRVACLLDRRIDPSRKIKMEFNRTSLLKSFQALAESAQADTSIVNHIIYIGPPENAHQIRTLIALRTDELNQILSRLSKPARSQTLQLLKRRTITWNDLDRPKDILNQVASAFHLTIENLDIIPHDLWAKATLPKTNAIEALSLIVVQFNLTFTWNQQGKAISLQPIEKKISLTKSYHPKSKLARLKLISKAKSLSGVKILSAQLPLKISGTVEQHEMLANHLQPRQNLPAPLPEAEKFTPLEQRLFTLNIKNVPALALMKKLEESGVKFVYDEESLKQSGVNLNQFIALNVKSVKAEIFFGKVFQPLGVKATFDKLTVKLRPLNKK